MIKLTLPPEPLKLTQSKQRLTEEYKRTGKAVWREKYITEVLLQATKSKCAYSEVKLQQNSCYMEVEHFKPKSKYPESVVEWGNLLPVCKTCNSKKGDHDVEAEPIIHPFFDDPKEYLYVKAFRYYHKNAIGERTIEKLDLNNSNHFVDRRGEEAETLEEQLKVQDDLLSSGVEPSKVVKRIAKVLQNCLNDSYSAVIATYILYESDVLRELEQTLIDKGQWTEQLQGLKSSLENIALPKPQN